MGTTEEGPHSPPAGSVPERQVIEVEVERLPREGEATPQDVRREALHRVEEGCGPVFAGMIIDLVDFTTIGPIGVVLGLPIGALCGHWLARKLGYGQRTSLIVALTCGLYCMFPPTSFLPLATLCGVFARFLWPDAARPGRGA